MCLLQLCFYAAIRIKHTSEKKFASLHPLEKEPRTRNKIAFYAL